MADIYRRARIKRYPHHPDRIVVVAVGRSARGLMIRTAIRETGDLRPGFASIQAAPESVPAACSQIKDTSVIWINGQALAHTAAGHVAADFEGQVKPAEGAALIVRAQDCTVLA